MAKKMTGAMRRATRGATRKLTIALDEDLYWRVKAAAVERRRSAVDMISEILEKACPPKRKRKR